MTKDERYLRIMADPERALKNIKDTMDDYDRQVDERAEQAFWEFDKRRKQTGAERDAFKAAWRHAHFWLPSDGDN